MVVGGRELIDTLWNVNRRRTSAKDCVPRINRYIVECKFCTPYRSCMVRIELIETLWNVNMSCN